MCFTRAGRIQTRLLSLVGPLLLMGVASVVQRDAGPLRMFALLALLTLALDAGPYHWLIGYQPRWLAVALGGLEFALLIGLMRGLGWGVDAGAALAVYAPAWALAWLTTNALLPWLRPRWAEDGGELRRR